MIVRAQTYFFYLKNIKHGFKVLINSNLIDFLLSGKTIHETHKIKAILLHFIGS